MPHEIDSIEVRISLCFGMVSLTSSQALGRELDL